MTSFIQTAHEFVGDLLSRQLHYQVPEHQRDYSWTEDEVSQFWEDITLGMQQRAEHFLGPTVVRQVEEGRLFEVIDGQQRLTTALILLAAIRNTYQENGDQLAVTIQTTYFGYVDRRSRETHPKFSMNCVNNDTFKEFINEIKPLDDIEAKLANRRTKQSNKRILQAYLFLKKKVEEKCRTPDGRNLSPLADIEDFLRERLSVIQIVVSDEADAYTLFETLNERGIELSVLDLLKNHLFKVAGASRESVKAKWQETLANLDESQGSKFIRHYWVSKHGRIQAGRLYRVIRDSARTKAAVVALAEDMKENSVLYGALSLPDHQLWDRYDQSVRNDIATLRLLNAQQCMPILMAAYHKFDRDDFKKTVRLMVIMAVRYSLICAYRTGALETTYADIAQNIANSTLRHAAQIRRQLGDLYPKDDEFREAFATRDIRSARHARFILRELETAANGGAVTAVNDPAAVNLEHVAPKSKNQNWSGIGNLHNESYEWWAMRLGNQCLLEKTINHAIGGEAFGQKRMLLVSSQISSTAEIGFEQTWTTAEIDARQRRQADAAVSIWKYDVDPLPQRSNASATLQLTNS